MQKAPWTNGTDFPAAEESAQRHGTEGIGHQSGVVIGDPEEPRTAPRTGKQQGSGRIPPAVSGFRTALAHVFVGSIAFPDLKLQGLSDPRECPETERPGGRITSDDVAHEKIPAAEIIHVLGSREPDHDIPARFNPAFFRERFDRFHEDLVGRAAAHRHHQIALRSGDGERFANRLTTLTDHAPQLHAAEMNEHTGGGLSPVGKDKEFLWFAGPTGKSPEDRHVREALREILHQHRGVEPQRVTKEKESAPVRKVFRQLELFIDGPCLHPDVLSSQKHHGASAHLFVFLARPDESSGAAAHHPAGPSLQLKNFDEFRKMRVPVAAQKHKGESGPARLLPQPARHLHTRFLVPCAQQHSGCRTDPGGRRKILLHDIKTDRMRHTHRSFKRNPGHEGNFWFRLRPDHVTGSMPISARFLAPVACAASLHAHAANPPDVGAFGFGGAGLTLETTWNDTAAIAGGGRLERMDGRLNIPLVRVPLSAGIYGNAGVRYGWDAIDVATPFVTGSYTLHTLEANLSVTHFPEKEATGWFWIAQAGPGVASDFGGLSADDFQISLLGVLGRKFTPDLSLAAAVYSRYQAGAFEAFPGVGLIWEPSEHWQFRLTPPAPSITWSPVPTWNFSIIAWPGGGAWNLSDGPAGRIDISSLRTAFALEKRVGEHFRAGAAAGWNFGSGIAIEDTRGRTVIDRDADDSFFASFTLRWAF
ncbi:MAG: hypothetical protein RLZZ179_2576 [Verrucomicrobiota bacterium]